MFGFNVKTVLTAALGLGLMAQTIPDCTRNATVISGDTCDGISKKYASPTFQFALANPDVDAACSNLMIGQEVCLGQRGVDCSKVHVVVKGDTCLGLADTYDLDDTVLYKNNPQINSECTNIYLNQVLCVASKPYPYVLPTNITSAPDSTSSVTSTVLPTNVPTAGPDAGSDDSGDVVTSTAEVWATVTQSAEGASETSSVSGLEYCEEGDQSPDCVDEESLPYCDEI
ncbi:hypothetical protein HD553DRAFT_79816 [Filobasidium floriforme]|uniref:uncharacterized protein n=1 Tax=Filobasidium floriforme TaxID=5210 RepID=UPI001E8EE882|nr:uncharacterized protein HD553DRAFT_79816 [Filobasidium floriforme]KAH8081372.1 hypothetical protein HD553DRAFT_79816 [Filobasidium floriforme]